MLPIDNWQVDFDSRYPIYMQIVNHFRKAIVRREIGPSDRIPSIRELSVALKVNANTIQRAYQEMERDNLIYSQRGTGYFIMNDEKITGIVKKTLVSRVMSDFLEEMRGLGFSDGQIVAALESELNKGGAGNGAYDS